MLFFFSRYEPRTGPNYIATTQGLRASDRQPASHTTEIHRACPSQLCRRRRRRHSLSPTTPLFQIQRPEELGKTSEKTTREMEWCASAASSGTAEEKGEKEKEEEDGSSISQRSAT